MTSLCINKNNCKEVAYAILHRWATSCNEAEKVVDIIFNHPVSIHEALEEVEGDLEELIEETHETEEIVEDELYYADLWRDSK